MSLINWNELLQEKEEFDLNLDEIFHLFLAQAEMKINLITQHLENKKFEELSREAHFLKGSSGSIRANTLIVICKELEGLAKTQNLKKSSKLLQDLKQELEKVRKEITSKLELT